MKTDKERVLFQLRKGPQSYRDICRNANISSARVHDAVHALGDNVRQVKVEGSKSVHVELVEGVSSHPQEYELEDEWETKTNPEFVPLLSPREMPEKAPEVVRINQPSGLYVALPDIHFDKHDPWALAAVTRFMDEFKPSAIVQLGDCHDAHMISRHPIRDFEQTIWTEAQAAKPWLTRWSDMAPFYMLRGNHPQRILNFRNENGGFSDHPLMTYEGMFDIPEAIEVLPQDAKLQVGKAFFEHGDKIGNSRGQPANLTGYIHKNRPYVDTFCGHFHGIAGRAYTVQDPSAPEGYREVWAASLGHLSLRHCHHYVSDPNWSKGFGVFDVRGDDFNFYQVRIKNGGFAFAGKEFNGY